MSEDEGADGEQKDEANGDCGVKKIFIPLGYQPARRKMEMKIMAGNQRLENDKAEDTAEASTRWGANQTADTAGPSWSRHDVARFLKVPLEQVTNKSRLYERGNGEKRKEGVPVDESHDPEWEELLG